MPEGNKLAIGSYFCYVSKFALCFFCWPRKIECRLANPCRAPLFKSSQTFFPSGLSPSRKMDGSWVRDIVIYQSLAQVNLCLALSIQRHQYLFVRSRNPNFSLFNALDLYFVSTKPYCKRIRCAFFKREILEIRTDIG